MVRASVPFLAIGALVAPIAAAASCDEALLQQAADDYLAAQTDGSTTQLTLLADGALYTENFNNTDISTGILSQALKIDRNTTLYDTTNCATYTELIVTDPSHPYVIGVQQRLTDGKLTDIGTIVTDQGDWQFNATGYLYWASKEEWGEIPEDERDSREVIQAAADAYADLFNDSSVIVPWGTPCDRLEGGVYVGNGSATDSCDVDVPTDIPMTNRRYVIDESKGSVDVFLLFGGEIPDSHEFRIEKGKIRYVHTMTGDLSALG
ncbi:MAG: hypothetical protein M1820_008035 [Bogoriella megaspora]|nr:MAG: hypothetical protein M1820_008035 [Bogoriella megaspora]